jgi:hypothetical protein
MHCFRCCLQLPHVPRSRLNALLPPIKTNLLPKLLFPLPIHPINKFLLPVSIHFGISGQVFLLSLVNKGLLELVIERVVRNRQDSLHVRILWGFHWCHIILSSCRFLVFAVISCIYHVQLGGLIKVKVVFGDCHVLFNWTLFYGWDLASLWKVLFGVEFVRPLIFGAF